MLFDEREEEEEDKLCRCVFMVRKIHYSRIQRGAKLLHVHLHPSSFTQSIKIRPSLSLSLPPLIHLFFMFMIKVLASNKTCCKNR